LRRKSRSADLAISREVAGVEAARAKARLRAMDPGPRPAPSGN